MLYGTTASLSVGKMREFTLCPMSFIMVPVSLKALGVIRLNAGQPSFDSENISSALSTQQKFIEWTIPGPSMSYVTHQYNWFSAVVWTNAISDQSSFAVLTNRTLRLA